MAKDMRAEQLLEEIFGENHPCLGGPGLPCGCCAKCGCFCGLLDGSWELALDENDDIVYRKVI